MSDPRSIFTPQICYDLSQALCEKFGIGLDMASSIVSWEAGKAIKAAEKKKESLSQDAVERVSKASIQCTTLLCNLIEQFTNLPQVDILDLIFRETRRLDKKLAGKDAGKITNQGVYLKTNCERALTYRENDPERLWKAHLREEDAGAWKELQEKCYIKIIGLLKKKGCEDESTQQDVWQETVVELFEQLKDSKRFIDQKLINYLAMLSLRKWYNMVRNHKTVSWEDFVENIDLDPDEDAPEDASLTVVLYDVENPDRSWARELPDDIVEFVLKTLHKMPNERYREVLIALFVGGLSREAIAQKIGVTLNNLKTIICRAMESLRDVLKVELKKHPDMAYWLRRLFDSDDEADLSLVPVLNSITGLLMILFC